MMYLEHQSDNLRQYLLHQSDKLRQHLLHQSDKLRQYLLHQSDKLRQHLLCHKTDTVEDNENVFFYALVVLSTTCGVIEHEFQ